jgi:hypothetical protein
VTDTITEAALRGQASTAAQQYHDDAVAFITKRYGEGYAKEHPELVAAFMQVAGMSYLANAAHGICQSGGSISSELETLLALDHANESPHGD